MKYFRKSVLAVIVYTVLVIIWGAYVRASGSGAGCGSHWPLCNGVVLPLAPSLKTQVEFFHRITSGISLILIMGISYWAYRIFPPKSFVRKPARVATISILLEALIGAGLVLFELVWQNQSMKRTISVSLHFSNTLVLVAALVLMWTGSGHPEKQWQWPNKELKRQALLFCTLFFTVGMAGAVTALGDTLFPAQSLAQGILEDFHFASHFLVKLRVIHPILAASFAFLLAPWVYNTGRTKSVTCKALLTGLVLNICLGIATLLALAPIPLQLAHLGMGLMLWILFVIFIDEAATSAGTSPQIHAI